MRPTPAVPVTRVRGGESRARVVVAIAGVAVALAVVKPWAPGGGAPAMAIGLDASPAADAAVAAAGTPGDTATEPGALPAGTPGLLLSGSGNGRGLIDLPGGGTLDCADPQGWLVVLDATTDGWRTRTWVAVDPGQPRDRSTRPRRSCGSPVARSRVLASVPRARQTARRRVGGPSGCGASSVMPLACPVSYISRRSARRVAASAA